MPIVPAQPDRRTTTASLFIEAAAYIEPPPDITVSEAAQEHRNLHNPPSYSGPWDPSQAPYTTEPMDSLGSRRYSVVVIMGPSQSAKTEIALNWLMATTIYYPSDFMWAQADKEVLRRFSIAKLDDMIDLCDELKEKQLTAPSADTVFLKQFVGAKWYLAWPTKSHFRMISLPNWVVDDFDAVPQNIGGEGNILTLLQGRQTRFEGAEVGAIISSPALGAKKGVEAEYNKGTKKTWRWPCPHCREYFEANYIEHFQFDRSAGPMDAERSACVVCPSCEQEIEPSHKGWMNALGCWSAEGQTVTAAGEIVGELPETAVDSYRIDGLMGFRSWGRLARMHYEAERAWEDGQDEEPLKAFWNTVIGVNYVSKLAGAEPVTADTLKARCGDYEIGTVPPGVRVLTASVDTQGDYWAVAVWGWAENYECWLVDRFDIQQLGDQRTKVDPAKYPEHWGMLLERVIWRRYPLAEDPDLTMPIINTAIDTQGVDGVYVNAAKFWGTARAAGVGDSRITLIKGASSDKGPLLPPSTPIDLEKAGKKRSKRGAHVFVPNVSHWKNILDARIRRPEPGPGYLHLPKDFDDAYLAELTAEEKQDGKWEKVRPRNETWDLWVYGTIALKRLAGSRMKMGWVPKSMRRPVREDGDEPPAAPPSAAAEAPAVPPSADGDRSQRKGRKRRRRRPPGRRSWLNSWKL
ncbi:MAG: phage terminase large subunit family protein [Minwuiales bacterium]|nr:phage terminase large subunit family protein [Minwuiales bacterium]